MEPIKELTGNEKLNKLASEIGQNPELFDEDAWMELFDASMLEAQRQEDVMSSEEQESFTAKNIAGFKQVKKRMERSSSKKMTLEELWEKSSEIEAALEDELKTESAATRKKPFSWKKRRKAFLLAAAVLVLGLGTTMIVQGDRAYELKQYPMSGQKNVMVNHNSTLRLDQKDILTEAYDQIRESLDITVLELGDIPAEMEYKNLVLMENSAVIQFSLNGNEIYFKQRKIPNLGELADVVISDRNTEYIVYNEWLNKDIMIEKNVLANGLVEYSAGFADDSISCYLAGIMEQEVFADLVQGIHK